MEPEKILKFAKRPVGATIATLVQFGLMPFVAYGLGLAFKMDEIKMLTMVILGCCPGGTLSNFMGKYNLFIKIYYCINLFANKFAAVPIIGGF